MVCIIYAYETNEIICTFLAKIDKTLILNFRFLKLAIAKLGFLASSANTISRAH